MFVYAAKGQGLVKEIDSNGILNYKFYPEYHENYEVIKNTTDSSVCKYVCFIKGNSFEKHDEECFTTKETDSLARLLLDKYEIPVIVSNCKNFTEYRQYDNYITDYYLYGYYYKNNKCYFLYKKVTYTETSIDNGVMVSFYIVKSGVSNYYKSTEYIDNFKIIDNFGNEIEGEIIFNN